MVHNMILKGDIRAIAFDADVARNPRAVLAR